jgi:hypothetical protein
MLISETISANAVCAAKGKRRPKTRIVFVKAVFFALRGLGVRLCIMAFR